MLLLILALLIGFCSMTGLMLIDTRFFRLGYSLLVLTIVMLILGLIFIGLMYWK